MMNVGNPELAFEFAQIPNGGVGLARLEFVINNMIGIHPKAILELSQLPASLRDEILRRSRGYATPKQFFIEKLVEGVATIAAAFYPKPVIVRLSDFKSNEYRKLLGGEIYEPEEENPMLGFRGASRYIAHSFRDCFELECVAMKKVRNELGLTNVQLMVPFVRNVEEAAGVVELLAAHGLKRGVNDLKLIMMCEILQRPAGGCLPGAFRRLLHRLQRPDPAHPGPGPGFRPGGPCLRRARPGGEAPPVPGHLQRQPPGQVRGHLRPGPLRTIRTWPSG